MVTVVAVTIMTLIRARPRCLVVYDDSFIRLLHSKRKCLKSLWESTSAGGGILVTYRTGVERRGVTCLGWGCHAAYVVAKARDTFPMKRGLFMSEGTFDRHFRE